MDDEKLLPKRCATDFFQKYFQAGQKTSIALASHPPSSLDLFMANNRKLIALLSPTLFVYTIYWLLAYHYAFYTLFATKWEMAAVMVFGGIVGGATAEGGGAVAFPVMTLLLKIPPTVARDFSVMIQTVGLNSAACSIHMMDLVIEKHTLIFGTIGGSFGTILCLENLDIVIPAAHKKIIFVSVFFSFAVALFILNKEKKRETRDIIHDFGFQDALILLGAGFIGGIFSGLAGTGLEVFCFSVITLLYRINEKVATSTTISLAGLNSAVSFFWRYHMQNAIEPLAWEYFAVCVPMVALFAPFGSFISSFLHRQTLAFFIYVLETVALISAFVILRPPPLLWILSLIIILITCTFYQFLSSVGKRLMHAESEKKLRPLLDVSFVV